MLAHGIDLVEVERIADLLVRHEDRFPERCFTEAERAYCDDRGRRRPEHYAARFAAKEAVMKALGTGLRHGISWTDIEVTRDGAGAPGVRLSGVAQSRAESLGVRSWLISLTHTDRAAMASVIALG
ncbi:MAG: holo-ACP synthase [Phycisphaerales bacterium JB037]